MCIRDRGQIRHVHANKMRAFIVRVQCCNVSDVDNEQVLIQGCGVINDSDVDFGEIIVPESVSVVDSLPSVKIDPAKLEHLITYAENRITTTARRVPGSLRRQTRSLPRRQTPYRGHTGVQGQADETISCGGSVQS